MCGGGGGGGRGGVGGGGGSGSAWFGFLSLGFIKMSQLQVVVLRPQTQLYSYIVRFYPFKPDN